MKDIYCDLLERYNEIGAEGAEAEEKILAGAEDSAYFRVFSQDRINSAEWFPWNRQMKVLAAGADYGVFAPLAERVARLDIADPSPERLDLIRRRFPELAADGGRLVLSGTVPDNGYDAVIADFACGGIPGLFGSSAESELAGLCGRLKRGGSLILMANNPNALRILAGDRQEQKDSLADEALVRQLCKEAGFAGIRVFYPLPNAEIAVNIYSDAFLPGSGSFKDISDFVSGDQTAVFNESTLYAALTEKGVFTDFAPCRIFVLTGCGMAGSDWTENLKLPDYVRYNRSRSEEFSLKTEIFTEFDQNTAEPSGRFVRKIALTPAGNAHIQSFAKKYALLSEELPEEVSILEPVLGETESGLSFAEFAFISGCELGRKLASEIKDGRAPEEEIRTALSRLLGSESAACRNQDALFENVIVREDGSFCLIDYEWVSEGPLSRGYMKWRVLSYWYDSYQGELGAYAGKQAFLESFGISAAAAEKYEELESVFQQKVRGSAVFAADRFRGQGITPARIREQELRLKELTDWNLRLQDEIEEHKTALSKEREVERLSQNHIRNIEKINEAQKNELEMLRAENAVLRRHQSLTSRIRRALIGRLDAWAPAGSRKRKLIRYTKSTVRHPLKQCRLYLTKEGRNFISGDFSIGGEFAEGGILTLPVCPEPLVSIVIPAYNQVAYTYACIRSIIAWTDPEKTPYEVILADDVSSDATREISSWIRNLVISRNSENMGFLKNCNQAAAKAKGKYIFFLNNDTKVHENWLSSLVRLMEADQSIGMAGSKLVYPDGRLQEAGGIIWSDASGWNYGRLDDPEKAEYNYVKDVDYISGAAIMIRTALWKEIGGFDEYFAPAYCEDSDLAFEVRRHGKRVVYQPQSVVTHFEGISNGTDVQGSGLKRYQLVNQEKFRKKWAEELKKQSVNTGNPDPFTARDRSQGKPCIAVIDHYVPTWDRDAGSKTTYQYLKMFLKKGFNVKFIGDNFLHEEPYTSELCQMGIEVLYGPEYRDNIYEYLRKNSGNINICYLNRPHIAVKYIDFLKKNTGIKCIFYGHDLHYLRILREYELTGEIRKKRESDYWRSIEYSVMQQADMVYYPSQVEIDEIHGYHPEICAKAITAYVWDSFPAIPEEEAARKSFSEREGLLFVGGFKHPPNTDGVKWFAEKIWPRVHQEIPEAVFYVAGSGAGEDILQLNGGGIEILGFVSDERLDELYRCTRLTVVPLRYGAGVKGKVVEAVYHQSVIVTTSVGAEGIPEAGTVMSVIDDDPEALMKNAGAAEEAFAEAVIRLYRDPELCARMSLACGGYIRDHYSLDAAWSVIEEDFQ